MSNTIQSSKLLHRKAHEKSPLSSTMTINRVPWLSDGESDGIASRTSFKSQRFGSLRPIAKTWPIALLSLLLMTIVWDCLWQGALSRMNGATLDDQTYFTSGKNGTRVTPRKGIACETQQTTDKKQRHHKYKQHAFGKRKAIRLEKHPHEHITFKTIQPREKLE